MIFLATRPELFTDGFGEWLEEHFFIYEEFERRALRLRASGRAHYGARGIWETMRYDSMIGELRGDFKLNDHRTPDLARLAMLMNKALDDFFETRTNPLSKRAA